MIFLYAFLVGGIICLLAQLCMDLFKLLPAHIVVIFVTLGSIFEAFHLYDKTYCICGCRCFNANI